MATTVPLTRRQRMLINIALDARAKQMRYNASCQPPERAWTARRLTSYAEEFEALNALIHGADIDVHK
jgi:hypothetical protein